MLRIYLIQNLYNLSDMATVAEVIDSRAFSEFCGVDSSNQAPDGDTLGRFRSLLMKGNLQEKSSVRAKVKYVFGVVKGQLRYRKTRYRGLQKQTAKLNMMFSPTNLILADRPCLAV